MAKHPKGDSKNDLVAASLRHTMRVKYPGDGEVTYHPGDAVPMPRAMASANGLAFSELEADAAEADAEQPSADSAPADGKADADGGDGDSEPENDLPAKLPGRAHFLSAGETSLAGVRERIAAGTLTEVDGIGSSTAGKVEAFLA